MTWGAKALTGVGGGVLKVEGKRSPGTEGQLGRLAWGLRRREHLRVNHAGWKGRRRQTSLQLLRGPKTLGHRDLGVQVAEAKCLSGEGGASTAGCSETV